VDCLTSPAFWGGPAFHGARVVFVGGSGSFNDDVCTSGGAASDASRIGGVEVLGAALLGGKAGGSSTVVEVSLAPLDASVLPLGQA